MKVIIMGCGRVGEQLARSLVDDGHQVTVVDRDASALDRLGKSFKGKRVQGVGFDRDILVEAGITEADAFAATSSSDNANIISARIARNVFNVPRVVTRLYDPRRAEIYQRLGLTTISSTTWGAQRIQELITHSEIEPDLAFGSGEVSLISMEVPHQLVGRNVKNLTITGELLVAAITREGKAILPISGTDFRQGDVVHLVVLSSALERLSRMLGLGEGD